MNEQVRDRVPRRLASRIALGYAVLGGLWIVLSGLWAAHWAARPESELAWAEMIKGLAFVGVTAALLYVFVRRALVDLRHAHEQRLAAMNRLSAITATMPDGLIMCTIDGEFEYANDNAYRLLGLDRQIDQRQAHEHLCVRLLDVDGRRFAVGQSPFERARTSETPIYGMEVRVIREDGRSVYLRMNISSIRAEDHRFRAMVATFTDVTRERESALALARAQRALTVLSISSASAMRSGGGAAVCLEACSALTTSGGYRFAWVGTPAPGSDARLHILARCGATDELLAAWNPHWGVAGDPQAIEVRAQREQRAIVVRGSDLIDAGGWQALAHGQGLGAVIAVPILASDHTPLGVLALGADSADAFEGEELSLLGILANQLAQAISSSDATGERDRALQQLRRIVDGSVRTIQAVVELRDPYTVGHEERVSQLAVAIARRLGLPDARVQMLEIAARLHDLGKAVVPTDILSKPGRLNPEEMALVRTHVDVGYRILCQAGFPEEVAEIVRQHHERLDGSGYPRQLRGDALMLEARVLAVADVAESMVTHRPYRPSRGIQDALKELSGGRGVRYEADVVDECLTLLRSGFLSDNTYPLGEAAND